MASYDLGKRKNGISPSCGISCLCIGLFCILLIIIICATSKPLKEHFSSRNAGMASRIFHTNGNALSGNPSTINNNDYLKQLHNTHDLGRMSQIISKAQSQVSDMPSTERFDSSAISSSVNALPRQYNQYASSAPKQYIPPSKQIYNSYSKNTSKTTKKDFDTTYPVVYNVNSESNAPKQTDIINAGSSANGGKHARPLKQTCNDIKYKPSKGFSVGNDRINSNSIVQPLRRCDADRVRSDNGRVITTPGRNDALSSAAIDDRKLGQSESFEPIESNGCGSNSRINGVNLTCLLGVNDGIRQVDKEWVLNNNAQAPRLNGQPMNRPDFNPQRRKY